jgi:hypothetical protein
MAATSMKLEGKRSVMAERAMLSDPSSSGWRSISRTSRGNSGNSSRKSMPLCARLASPGRGMPAPPPIRPASEMVWWGERKGRSMEESGARSQGSGDAVDLGGFDGLFEGERRQDAGEALGEHGLAGAGRADHEDIVHAGGGHFEGAFGHGLAAHVAEIGRRLGCLRMAVARGDRGRKLLGAGEQGDHFGQIADAVHVDAFHHGRLGGVLGGNDQVGDALLARADGDGQRAAHGAYGAIERKLADEDVLVQGLHRAHGAQDADGHGQIEAGAFLAHVGRGQVDGDAFVGVAEAGIDERALDALAAFADGDVGHADHYGVPRVAGREHVDFDIDQVSIDAIDRSAAGLEERHENDSGAGAAKLSTIFGERGRIGAGGGT